jgi:hypothetical protein
MGGSDPKGHGPGTVKEDLKRYILLFDMDGPTAVMWSHGTNRTAVDGRGLLPRGPKRGTEKGTFYFLTWTAWRQ